MKTFYQCEICGFTSESIDEVRKCESQNIVNQYREWQKLEFLYIPRTIPGDTGWIPVRVMKVCVEQRSHHFYYQVRTETDDSTMQVVDDDTYTVDQSEEGTRLRLRQ